MTAPRVAVVGGGIAGLSVAHAIGRSLGRDLVRRLAGDRLNALSRRLARRGLIAMTFVRIVPIAPFSIVNIVAGASHIGWRDLMLGSIIGMLPGIALTAVLVDRAVAVAQNPGPDTVAVLAAIAALAVGAIWWLQKRLAGNPATLPPAEHVG